MEHETNKLKSQDEEYQRELREWKENLKPRKQVSLRIINAVATKFLSFSSRILIIFGNLTIG